jgi:hypothetical protein
MRRETAHWIVAYVAVGLSAGLAAWSGVRASDATSIVDGTIKGAIMFVIAVLGCHGWGWAARLWKDGHAFWAVIAGTVLTVAMAVTLIGGAGSFYGAAAEKIAVAERGSDAYARADAELKNIEAKRKALTKHRSVGEIDPDITTAKADKRYKATNECDPVHITKSAEFCASFRALERERAAAEESQRLDRLAAPYKAVIGRGRPSQGGGWGALLAAMFGIGIERGNAVFAFMCTIALDMGAVVAVLTAELREPSHPSERPKEPKRDMRPLDRLFARWRRHPGEVETIVAEPTLDEIYEPPRIEAPPAPKLVVSSGARRAGSIPKIVSAALEPAKGSRVEFEEVFAAYAAECTKQGVAAVKPEEFVDPLKRFCRACRITAKVEGGRVYLMNVRLAASEPLRLGGPPA